MNGIFMEGIEKAKIGALRPPIFGVGLFGEVILTRL